MSLDSLQLPVAEGEVKTAAGNDPSGLSTIGIKARPGTVTGLTATSEPVRYARWLEDYL